MYSPKFIRTYCITVNTLILRFNFLIFIFREIKFAILQIFAFS